MIGGSFENECYYVIVMSGSYDCWKGKNEKIMFTQQPNNSKKSI